MNIITIRQVLRLFKKNPLRTTLLVLVLLMVVVCYHVIEGYFVSLGSSAASTKNTGNESRAPEQSTRIEVNNNEDGTIVTGDNNVIHNYSKSKSSEDVIQKKIEDQDEAISQIHSAIENLGVDGKWREALLEAQLVKYGDLENRLAIRSANSSIIKDAMRKLRLGDFSGAETSLSRSMNRYWSQKQYAKALADVRDLITMRELQLDQIGAEQFKEKLGELESRIETQDQSSSTAKLKHERRAAESGHPRPPVLRLKKEGASKRRARYYSESELLDRYPRYFATLTSLFKRIIEDYLLPDESLVVCDAWLNIINHKTALDPFSIWISTDNATINISIQTLAFIDDICGLAAYLVAKHNFNEYGQVYAVRVACGAMKTGEGLCVDPLSVFGIDSSDISEPEMIAHREMLFESALSFLLIHEIGRLYAALCYHQSIAEFDADAFTLQTMYRAGCQPWGMNYILPVMYWLQERSGGSNEDQEKDAIRARMAAIIGWLDNPPDNGDGEVFYDAIECSHELKNLTHTIMATSASQRKRFFERHKIATSLSRESPGIKPPTLRIVAQ
jgi:hypothetical protein